METWPLDNRVTALKERIIKPSNRQTSSAGYSMTRPKGTVKKRAFTIQMSYITYAEKTHATLGIEKFFDDNQGVAFLINSPDPNDTGGPYTVIFDQDQLEFEYTRVFPGEYSLELNVKEI